MDIPRYNLLINTDVTLFRFKSKGINGEIDKGIIYKSTKNGNIFNIPFDSNGDFYGFFIKRK